MKTSLLIVFMVLSVSLVSFADARTFTPFSFHLADEMMYNDLPFYVDGSKTNFQVDRGETATFPLAIISKAADGTVVNFHATIDNNQMGEIRFPPGVNIQLEPNQMILNGEDKILSVTVHVSEKAPSSKYNINLVGVWKEEGKIPDFMGTSFSLHVGRDFGNDAIPVNFFMPPLKFAKDGMSPEEIPCRNNFILILKYDDSPACVNHETKPKLIQRGWMKTQVDVFDDLAFIESTKNLDAVQQFMSLHPQVHVSIDTEQFAVHYTESGFKEHRTTSVIHHTKELMVGIDYQGNPFAQSVGCGGPISLSTTNISFLENPDWCFPIDQTPFDNEEQIHDTCEPGPSIAEGYCKDGKEIFFASNSEINYNCMTLEQSKDIAPFFKIPSFLPEGYSVKCSSSGMPYESYVIYHNRDVSDGWKGKLHELIEGGAIFIHQVDERNMIDEEKYATLGSAEQRIQSTYDSVMESNPSLQPQMIRINGMLMYAVDSCHDCGMQTADFPDGTIIQKSTSTETKIKFIDEDGITYMLKTTLPLDELIMVAESLQ